MAWLFIRGAQTSSLDLCFRPSSTKRLFSYLGFLNLHLLFMTVQYFTQKFTQFTYLASRELISATPAISVRLVTVSREESLKKENAKLLLLIFLSTNTASFAGKRKSLLI